ADLGPMRAEHRILGLQLGGGPFMARLEAFGKTYRDLAQETRENQVISGGTGRSRGLDVFVRWPAFAGISGRMSYSYIHARRTDPNTLILARSPFDITHVMTSVLERRFGPAWAVSLALRAATGRPFTPITSARFDSARAVWEPAYGAPNSERLPSFQRVDVSMSRLIPLPGQRLLVVFVAANNLFDRINVHDYRYDATYQARTPVRSQFKRSIYFGASVTF
ncbi:MAG: TonB-dependent receptor domain-containing protein, partial [Longimicrobiales bacterium]